METLETKPKKEYRCKPCDKSYSTSQNLWKHNNKFHNGKSNVCNPHSNFIVIQKLDSCHPEVTIKSSNKHICKNCKKEFKYRQGKWKHEKNCKAKDEEENKLKEKDNIIKNLQKELCELKKEKNISKNINNGNIYNGKVINNITINAPGHELMTLTKEDVESIFEDKLLSVITYIEKTNFNKNKKYNHNFCTTNQNGKYLSYYDQESSTIKTTKKKYFYHDMISNGITKIKTSFNKFKNKIKKEKQEQFQEIITRLEQIKDCDFNNKMLKGVIDELNLLSYNSRNVVLDTWNIDEKDIINDMKDNDYREYFINIESTKATCNDLQKNEPLDSDDESISVKKELIFGKKHFIHHSSSSSDESDIEL